MACNVQRISTFLWFDNQAEEAVNFYMSIFPNSSIGKIVRYSNPPTDGTPRKEPGVLTIAFTLDGQEFTALNGGPHFKFNEAISLVVACADQAELDYYWDRLSAGGPPEAQQCGWLKDKFGVSWQVVPANIAELLADPDPERARRTGDALMKMKKLDIAALHRAAAG